MRFWTNRPVLVLLVALVLLAAMIAYFVSPGPKHASGQVNGNGPSAAEYRRHLDNLMDEIDGQ